jgi:hypothetical protein
MGRERVFPAFFTPKRGFHPGGVITSARLVAALVEQIADGFSEQVFDRSALLGGKHFETAASLRREVTLELHGLAAALEHHTGLSSAASPKELRQTAVGVRAVANQAFMTAAATAGVGERLAAWADVSGIVFPPSEAWREPERAGD